jgi:hypothetical protein
MLGRLTASRRSRVLNSYRARCVGEKLPPRVVCGARRLGVDLAVEA